MSIVTCGTSAWNSIKWCFYPRSIKYFVITMTENQIHYMSLESRLKHPDVVLTSTGSKSMIAAPTDAENNWVPFMRRNHRYRTRKNAKGVVMCSHKCKDCYNIFHRDSDPICLICTQTSSVIYSVTIFVQSKTIKSPSFHVYIQNIKSSFTSSNLKAEWNRTSTAMNAIDRIWHHSKVY